RWASGPGGPATDNARAPDIPSDAIPPGSIQIPGNGKPIVLLADRQTTGGYPKIATVISADLPALGRLAIGAPVHFQPVTIEEAVEARRRLIAELDDLATKIVPLRAGASIVASRLFGANLISGVFGLDDAPWLSPTARTTS